MHCRCRAAAPSLYPVVSPLCRPPGLHSCAAPPPHPWPPHINGLVARCHIHVPGPHFPWAILSLGHTEPWPHFPCATLSLGHTFPGPH
eukprot:365389-Chlamydomonas_euryale.AAC.11